jgi:spermidine synthase
VLFRSALLLGLGGGCLAQALRRGYPQCRITAVELRAAVLQVARELFFLPEDERLVLIQAAAADYLAADPPGPQDLIFADLYLADRMAPEQRDEDLLAACRRLLSPQGVLVLNLWASDFQGTLETGRLLDDLFAGQLLSLQVQGGNIILFGCAGGLPDLQPKRWLAAAEALGLTMGIPLQRLAQQLWRQNAQTLRIGRLRRGSGPPGG